MGESTALEALTAELLGDVGKLHDDIKAMPERLAVASRILEEKTGAFVKAAEFYREEIDRWIHAQAEHAAKNCVANVQEQVRSIVDSAIKESLGSDLAQTISNIKSVTSEAQKSIKATENHIEKVADKMWIKTTVWSIVGGLFGGLMMAIILLKFGR